MSRPSFAQKLFFSGLLAALCTLASLAAAQQRAQSAPLRSNRSWHGVEISDLASAGNASLAVQRYTAYLAAVRRGYRQWINGDFQDGMTGWENGRGPFSGHGSGLPVDVTKRNGENRVLLLGMPAATDNAIPVGYGTVFQSLTLENRYVHLRYWVYSYDIAKGTERYYDTLEVSVNRAPDEISDSDRNRQGCSTTALNPQGTLIVMGDGLIFCAGRPGGSGQGIPWDTQGWRDVTLDLQAYRGKNITLYFTVWSREYDSAFRDDRGWFNTWAYVDDVVPSNATVASTVTDADEPPSVLNAVADRAGAVQGEAMSAPAREH